MINERPLNSNDIVTLDNDVLLINKRKRFITKYFVGYTILVLICSIWAYFKIDSENLIVLIFTSIGFFVAGLWGFLEMYLKENKKLKNISWLKNENKVLSIVVKSNDFIEIPEHEDEGDYYLFQLPDNRILYVGGQEFYPNETFPSNNFEIVIAKDPKNKIILFQRNDLGEKISPKIKLTKNQSIKLTDEQISEINQQDVILREIVTIITGHIDKITIVDEAVT